MTGIFPPNQRENEFTHCARKSRQTWCECTGGTLRSQDRCESDSNQGQMLPQMGSLAPGQGPFVLRSLRFRAASEVQKSSSPHLSSQAPVRE